VRERLGGCCFPLNPRPHHQSRLRFPEGSAIHAPVTGCGASKSPAARASQRSGGCAKRTIPHNRNSRAAACATPKITLLSA
jgi:hypothetical protein